MKKGEVFKSKYLKFEDLCGQTVNLHISTVMLEEIGQEVKEAKAVVYFVGKQKGLVLNVINWSTIEDMYGEDSDNWSGKQISIFPTTTEFGGKMVGCIRVTPGQSPATAQAAAFVEQAQVQTQEPAQLPAQIPTSAPDPLSGQSPAAAQSPATANDPFDDVPF